MSEKRYCVEEVEVISSEAISAGATTGEMWQAVTDKVDTVSYEVRNNDVARELCDLLNSLMDNNELLQQENKFLYKIIDFIADNPATKYSSRNELLEEMKLFEKMGLI